MRFDLLKILLVDDNPHMRVLLTQILRAIDVRHIHEASDGAEALQIMRATNIDIVVTDLTMQPLDGIGQYLYPARFDTSSGPNGHP